TLLGNFIAAFEFATTRPRAMTTSGRTRAHKRGARVPGLHSGPPMRRVFALVLTFLMLICLAAAAAAQARVEGTVTGIDGKPVAGAMVRVEGSELRKARTTTTRADGGYVVDDLKLGQWLQVIAFQDGRRLAVGSTLVSQAIEKLDLTARAEQATEVVDIEDL